MDTLSRELIDKDVLLKDIRETITERSDTFDWFNLISKQEVVADNKNLDKAFINQAINNCFLTKKYGNPGKEEGMCACIRTMNGDGEPCDTCKACKLNYLYDRS